jgi:hypothetical protein
MEKQIKIFWMAVIIFVVACAQKSYCLQKILVIIDSSAYYSEGSFVQSYYIPDIINYDHKHAEMFVLSDSTGTDVAQCRRVWQKLQDEYFHAIDSGDVLEGAVLIGNVPVPEANFGGAYGPLDQVYMDVVNASSGQPVRYSNFSFDTSLGGYFTTTYGTGDQIYDIWISRINACYLNGGIEHGPYVDPEMVVYDKYLHRVHDRMTSPANVPSRGFAMGGPEDQYDIHFSLGQHMDSLQLPMVAEFSRGENTPYNWMSQLLAGPRGCINYGGFNHNLFSSERNRRYCIYTHLDSVYLQGENGVHPGGIDISDSLGWEWAGVFGHSTPGHTEFFGIENEGVFNNGFFSFGTLAPFWGTNYRYSTGGYNNLGYFWYQDFDTTQDNPYQYPRYFKHKVARWLWKVSSSKSYNMYVYYKPDQNNNNSVGSFLYNTTVNNEGTPGSELSIKYINPNPPHDSLYWAYNRVPIVINFQQHDNIYQPGLSSDTNWRCVDNLNLTAGSMALLFMETNDGNSGNYIADAIRFISTDGAVDTILVNNGPSSYPDSNNQPYKILSTNGFFTSDEIDRGYEDMGDEIGGGGFAKPQFYMTKACWINNFITTSATIDGLSSGLIKNLGNLYALGHNGLICFGTANNDAPGQDKSPFTVALRNGKDFGEAFLAEQNYAGNFSGPFYSLLGAGNLHALPYIQFGSDLEQNESITTTISINKNQPILMQGVTVSGSGNLTVTSTNNSSSPPGTHSEIKVRPETDFNPTGTNVVHLIVN